MTKSQGQSGWWEDLLLKVQVIKVQTENLYSKKQHSSEEYSRSTSNIRLRWDTVDDTDDKYAKLPLIIMLAEV